MAIPPIEQNNYPGSQVSHFVSIISPIHWVEGEDRVVYFDPFGLCCGWVRITVLSYLIVCHYRDALEWFTNVLFEMPKILSVFWEALFPKVV